MNIIIGLLKEFASGLMLSIVTPLIAISAASLIFTNVYSPYLAFGISFALAGVAISNFVMAPFNSFKFAISGIDAPTAALILLILLKIAPDISSVEMLPTAIATIVLVTILTGLVLFVVGHFKLANTFRYIPFPVIGGFTAGTGWLIIKGAIIMLYNFSEWSSLWHWESLLIGLPAVSLALILQFAYRKTKNYLVQPVILLVSIPLVFLILKMFDISNAVAIDHEILFNNMVSANHWQELHWSMLSDVKWGAIASNFAYFISASSIVLLLLILNLNALEVVTDKHVNLNRELKVNGGANVLNGFLFGVLANTRLTNSVLNYEAGARTNLPAFMVGITALAIVIFKINIVAFIPKVVLVGFLLSIGMGLLMDWLITSRSKLGYTDYAVVLIIVATIMVFGLIQGVAVGIFITSIFFVLKYSKNGFIKFLVTGKTHRSHVNYSPYLEKYLRDHGEERVLIKLQGSIFFGSAATLFKNIYDTIEYFSKRLKYLILDFQFVEWIDASAVYHFLTLRKICNEYHIQLIFSDCNERVKKELKKMGIVDDPNMSIMFFSDADRAMEWCEKQVIKKVEDLESKKSIYEHLQDENGARMKESEVEVLLKYLRRIELPKDAYLFRQDESSDSMYFLESGKIEAVLENGKQKRLTETQQGGIIGEIGFFLRVPRTASALVTEDAILYKLSRKSYDHMKIIDPHILSIFEESIIKDLAEKVVRNNYEIKLLTTISTTEMRNLEGDHGHI